MKKILAVLAAILLFGCVQPLPPGVTPTPTAAPPGYAPTPIPPAAVSNFSSELRALAEASKDLKIMDGEMLETFEKINNAKASIADYAAHLQSLDPSANETIFLQKNVEALQHLLTSNEYYLGALNTGRMRTTENFTCKEMGAYSLTLNFLSNAVDHGLLAVNILHSLAGEYPVLAYEAGSQVAGDLIKAYYDGMAESVNETRAFLKTQCG